MKRVLLSMLILVLLCGVTACQPTEEDETGNTTTTGGTTGTTSSSRYLDEYDTDGNLVVRYLQNGPGHYLGKWVYTYQNGLRATETQYDDENRKTAVKTYEYTDGGSLAAYDLIRYDEDGEISGYERLEYAETGRTGAVFTYDAEHTLLSKKEYRYTPGQYAFRIFDYSYADGVPYGLVVSDHTGRVQYEEHYDAETNEVYWRVTYTYRDNRRERALYLDDSYDLYRYDEEGNYLGYESYDADGVKIGEEFLKPSEGGQ